MTDAAGEADAVMDPWCVVTLASGADVLLGYALRHSRTGGLSWVRSPPIVSLDEETGHAETESGRRYALGRRVALIDLPRVSEEGFIAYILLIAREEGTIPDNNLDLETAALWLMAQKAARWLHVDPPRRARPELDAWWAEHQEAYLAMRAVWKRGRQGEDG